MVPATERVGRRCKARNGRAAVSCGHAPPARSVPCAPIHEPPLATPRRAHPLAGGHRGTLVPRPGSGATASTHARATRHRRGAADVAPAAPDPAARCNGRVRRLGSGRGLGAGTRSRADSRTAPHARCTPRCRDAVRAAGAARRLDPARCASADRGPGRIGARPERARTDPRAGLARCQTARRGPRSAARRRRPPGAPGHGLPARCGGARSRRGLAAARGRGAPQGVCGRPGGLRIRVLVVRFDQRLRLHHRARVSPPRLSTNSVSVRRRTRPWLPTARSRSRIDAPSEPNAPSAAALSFPRSTGPNTRSGCCGSSRFAWPRRACSGHPPHRRTSGRAPPPTSKSWPNSRSHTGRPGTRSSQPSCKASGSRQSRFQLRRRSEWSSWTIAATRAFPCRPCHAEPRSAVAPRPSPRMIAPR